MGDHLVLLVDRLLTESTLEAALESRNCSMQAASSAMKDTEVDVTLMKMSLEDMKSPGKLVLCRIYHDEDEDTNMETPCSCGGSLKTSKLKLASFWPSVPSVGYLLSVPMMLPNGDPVCRSLSIQLKLDFQRQSVPSVGLIAYSPLGDGSLSRKYIDINSEAANERRLNLFPGYMQRCNQSLERACNSLVS